MDRINEKVGIWLLEPTNTRKKLADLLGFSTVTLSKKLAGKTDWTWSEVKKLAGILGCSLDEFFEPAVA